MCTFFFWLKGPSNDHKQFTFPSLLVTLNPRSRNIYSIHEFSIPTGDFFNAHSTVSSQENQLQRLEWFTIFHRLLTRNQLSGSSSI